MLDEQESRLDEVNFKYWQQQYDKHKKLFDVSYSRNEHPELLSKYEGYMQIHRKKLSYPLTEYFSSSFLNELREKRNSMFSDEIIDKMQKSYKMKEYATEVDWTKYIPQSDIKSSSKFAPVQTPMIESYVEIEKKMLK